MVNPYNEYKAILRVKSYKDKWSKETIKKFIKEHM